MKHTQKSIPKGWKVKKVIDVFDFIKTYSHSKEEMSYGVSVGDVVFNIHYGDIHTKYSTYVDFSKDRVPFLKNTDEEIDSNKLLQSGDLVIVDASEDYVGVCDSVELINLEKKKCIAGLHTFALREKGHNTSDGYRVLLIKNPNVHNWLMKVSTYSKVYGVNKESLEQTYLFLPPLPEQQRIVAILEAWDRGIEILKQKIEMKKEVKRGLMQQLLTDRKYASNVAGSGEQKSIKQEKYPMVELEEVCDVVLDKPPKFSEKKRYYATKSVDVSEIIDFNMVTYNNRPSRANIYPNVDDVGFAKMKGTKKVIFIDKSLYGDIFSTGFMFLRPNPLKIVPKFLYYLVIGDIFQSDKDILIADAIMGAIRKDDALTLNIPLPPLSEQRKIASILTTADQEIATLEKKLEFWQNQKKYLLRNLVTGQILTPADMPKRLLSTNQQ